MNKTLLSAALIAGFGVAAFAPQAARAADSGTITFQGKVLSSTCNVDVANSGNSDGTVTLPNVATSALTANGPYTPSATSFNLALSNCPTVPSGVKVGAQFFGANADTTTGKGTLMNSTATGSAVGVDVQLLDGNSAPVTIGTTASGSTVSDQTPLTSGSATLAYTAQYYVTDTTTLAAGTVSTTVGYQINYQ